MTEKQQTAWAVVAGCLLGMALCVVAAVVRQRLSLGG